MTAAEREVCIAMAAVLHAQRTLADLGLLTTIVMAAALAAVSLLAIEIRTLALAAVTVALLLGAMERYFAFRIRLDERLFDALGTGQLAATSSVDDALLRLHLVGKAGSARSLDQRLKGASRLCMRHCVLVVCQWLAVIFFATMQSL